MAIQVFMHHFAFHSVPARRARQRSAAQLQVPLETVRRFLSPAHWAHSGVARVGGMPAQVCAAKGSKLALPAEEQQRPSGIHEATKQAH